MSETLLKYRVETVINEAKDLAEYWGGTLHEAIITQDLNRLLDILPEKVPKLTVKRLEKLENQLDIARAEIERSENEG